ncbi:MAG: pyridoxamine 5'-phosphate oxidase family protein [Alphaproteobacteria bacterium]|nr:pyridoxamine 5'-phosphate oxidase family protein [Alphaproteobacteria bacterium]TAD91617.1 MAG: pyridoxamine 5'-phosphate oxidase family protein [Alphaproteobacteria bacterium]
MGRTYDTLTEAHQAFLAAQKVFFVATAAPGARVNLSPKGLDCLRILSDRAVCWLDVTGSGAETAAHLAADGRLTVMACAFEGSPLILRLYGRGTSLPRGSAGYQALLSSAFADREPPGARQIVRLDFDLVQTSCGFGVPLMSFQEDRQTLLTWAEGQGEDGLRAYRAKKNAKSLDGLPTGLVTD